MWRVLQYLTILTTLVFACGTAQAEKRVALVIGNGVYTKVPQLGNPSRDAAAIEAMFKAARFDVVQRVTDLGAAAMRRVLRDFSDHASDADIAIVFYAGHGIEVNGINYLVPVDAILERDIDVADEAIPLERVGELLERAKRLRLIILDACRDNPFTRSMKRTVASRTIGRGLGKVEVANSDTLIAYAARAGSTASDGEGMNSPYTSALLKHLATPGLDVRLALGRVRDQVLLDTRSKQEPFVYGSLGGAEIALVPGKAPDAAAAEIRIEELKRAADAAREAGDVARAAAEEARQQAVREREMRLAAEAAKREAEVKTRAEQEQKRLAKLEQQSEEKAALKKKQSEDAARAKLDEERRLAALDLQKREDAKKSHPKEEKGGNTKKSISETVGRCPSRARARWKTYPTGSGALALGDDNCGFSWGFKSQQLADDRALLECRKKTSNCKIVERH